MNGIILKCINTIHIISFFSGDYGNTIEYECSNMGNQYPVCEPTSNDVWYQGSEYKLIWNYK